MKENIFVRVDTELKEQLKKEAEWNGTSVSGIIRKIILDYFRTKSIN